MAAVAGFTKGAVYSNFKNKEDLFLALLDSLREREMEALHQTLESSDIPAGSRLEDFVEFTEGAARTDRLELDRPLPRVLSLRDAGQPAARRRLIEQQNASIDDLAEIIEREIKNGISTPNRLELPVSWRSSRRARRSCAARPESVDEPSWRSLSLPRTSVTRSRRFGAASRPCS